MNDQDNQIADADGEPVIVRWMNYRFWPATLEQMMSDRELLEYAAKAAGIVGDVEEFYIHRDDKVPVLAIETEGGVWDPIHDNGDARRLAADLGIRVTMPEYDSDPIAATRRAIVRAAADIGMNLTSAKPAPTPDAEPGKPRRPVRAP